MQDYASVGCGHCGIGVVPRLAPVCPFRQEPVCDRCYAEVLQFVTDMQARGHDPLPKGRRRRGGRESSPRPLL